MLQVEIIDEIHVLTLDHGKANTLDIQLCEQLTRHLNKLAHSAKALVITGTGNCFSAGVDLLQIRDGGVPYIDHFLTSLRETFMAAFNFPKPMVAAINGHAVAGGCILACAADFRIMTNSVGRIGVAELSVGVPFPAAALEILRFAGRGQYLQQMIYTGRLVAGKEALDMGLIDSLEDQESLLDSACETARSLAAIEPLSFALTKQRLRASVLDALATPGTKEYERRIDEAWQSAEIRKAIADYVAATLDR